jgi:hypothetical protein
MSTEEIIEDHPDLGRDDLLAALEFGALASGIVGWCRSAPREVRHRRPVAGQGASDPRTSSPSTLSKITLRPLFGKLVHFIG